MSNRLPQYVKDQIIASIKADIPRKPQEVVKVEIQNALLKGMSISCRNLYKKNPKALRTICVNHSHGLDRYTDLICGDANTDEVLSVFVQQVKDRKAVIEKLTSAINSCSTRKQFVDRFPELTNYLPKDCDTCATLPAVANLIADLVKIGFEPKVESAA